jgi:hypothetical protein
MATRKPQEPGIGAASAQAYGRVMATLHIEHPITDYDTWRTAFERLADARRTAGVISGRVARPIEDPHYIVLTLDFDTTERASAFLRFLETQVWTSAAAAPALGGSRRTVILEAEPAAVV